MFLEIGRLRSTLGTTGMKILFVVLLVFSTAQENQGLDNKTNQNQNISKNETETKIDESTISRVKRYATHMNSFLRNFNFFNNDGKHSWRLYDFPTRILYDLWWLLCWSQYLLLKWEFCSHSWRILQSSVFEAHYVNRKYQKTNSVLVLCILCAEK